MSQAVNSVARTLHWIGANDLNIDPVTTVRGTGCYVAGTPLLIDHMYLAEQTTRRLR